MSRATPVNFVDLVSHLSVYKSSYPAIRVLRACHRYGKGEHAYINRLPVEVIDMIIVEMLNTQHPAVTKEGYDMSECFEVRCKRESHYNASELEKVLKEAMKDRLEAHDADSARSCRETGCNGTCINYPAISDEDVQDLMYYGHVDYPNYGEIHIARHHHYRNLVSEEFIKDNIQRVSRTRLLLQIDTRRYSAYKTNNGPLAHYSTQES